MAGHQVVARNLVIVIVNIVKSAGGAPAVWHEDCSGRIHHTSTTEGQDPPSPALNCVGVKTFQCTSGVSNHTACENVSNGGSAYPY